jgi:hypothetical protein
MLLDMRAKLTIRPRLRGAHHRSVECRQCDGLGSAGHLHSLHDLGDDADFRVVIAVTRHEQDLRLLAESQGQRDVHTRENDRVVQRDQSQ